MMTRKRRGYTKADVKYLMAAIEATGKNVAYVKHCSDDSGFRVIVRDPAEARRKSESSDELALAGWDDVKSDDKV